MDTRPDAPYRATAGWLNSSGDELLPRWQATYARSERRVLTRDPTWLLDRYEHGEGQVEGRDDIFVVFLERGDETVGVAPFLLLRWPMYCQIGELTVAKLPFRRACLPLCDLDIPADPTAYDCVFATMAQHAAHFDAIYFEDLATNGVLAHYLDQSPLVAQLFHQCRPEEPTYHSLIRMPRSMDEYLGKFSSKTRATLRRKVRKLTDRGEVKVTRVMKPGEVDAFADAAARVSRKSYQYNLLGLGMRDIKQDARQFRFWAEHGWLRSYLLEVGGEPCCYLIGLQDDQCFYYWDVAQDTDWNKLSVGTVLQYHVLEDLFAERTPELFDFSSGPGDHKEFFANERYEGVDVYLTVKRAYPRTALTAYRASKQLTDHVSALLDRYELKNKVRRAMRSASVMFKQH